jgi:hypothetical protein
MKMYVFSCSCVILAPVKNNFSQISFQDPLASDLVLSLTLDGIRLLFDSITQRLRVIEIFSMNLIKLKYW